MRTTRGLRLKVVATSGLLTFLGLLLGLRCAFLLAVHDETGPGFFLVPLEAGENGGLELIVGLVVAEGVSFRGRKGRVEKDTYLLAELLVDSVQRVLDGDAAQVPRRHLQAEREVQVDLLDRRLGEHQLEEGLLGLVDGQGGFVDAPGGRGSVVNVGLADIGGPGIERRMEISTW